MHSSASDPDRNVIPRWRPLHGMASEEVSSASVTEPYVAFRPDDYAAEIEIWRKENSLSSATDIFDTGALLGDRRLIAEGVRRLRPHRDVLPERVKDAIARVLRRDESPAIKQQRISALETDTEYVRRSLAVLRRQKRDSPRNALLYLEAARLYLSQGETEKSEREILFANQLAPDNRIILRALTSFYEAIGEVGTALPHLWRSQRLQADPWVQSAEIAAADLADRGSKIASRAVKKIKSARELPRSHSELAMAIATLERASGVPQRQVFKYVRSALEHATENALAQAVWLSEQTGRSFHQRFPEFTLSEEANEAKALDFYERDEFVPALDEAERWLRDQPFQTQPALMIMNINSVRAINVGRAVPVAERAVRLHRSDWTVVNAALLTFAEAGDVVRASEMASSLERLVSDDAGRAFAAAGRGRVQFLLGDVYAAEASYLDALKYAKDAKRSDLVVNAYMFWLRQEVKTVGIGGAVLSETISSLEKAISKVPTEFRSSISKNWKSIKEEIEQEIPITGNHEGPALAVPRAMEDEINFIGAGD